MLESRPIIKLPPIPEEVKGDMRLYFEQMHAAIANQAKDVFIDLYHTITGGTGDLAGEVTSKGLVVKVNATNPLYQIDVDADVLALDDTTRILTDVDLTIDITVSGANGLDTGSEASSTWYSIWVIHNPSINAVVGLLSLSATAPTMPTGYTKKRRVGWVLNHSDSTFRKCHRIGDWWFWDNPYTILITAAAANDWTDVDCSAAVPSTSELILLTIYVGNIDDDQATTAIRGNGTAAAESQVMIGGSAEAVGGYGWNGIGIITPCDSSQVIEYRNSVGAETLEIKVQGYHDPV